MLHSKHVARRERKREIERGERKEKRKRSVKTHAISKGRAAAPLQERSINKRVRHTFSPSITGLMGRKNHPPHRLMSNDREDKETHE